MSMAPFRPRRNQNQNDAWVTYRDTAVANTDFGNSCSSGPAQVHHFEISHDGSGSTCAAESATVKACLDSNCTQLSTDSITADFQFAGSTKSSLTFVGSTTVNFNHTSVQTAALSLANTSVTPTNSLVCDNGGNNCNMAFSDAGCNSENTCANIFADAATNSSGSGEIRFEHYGRLINNPDTVLASPSVVHSGSLISTCATADCTASGTTVSAPTSQYQGYTSSNNLTISGRSQTISSNNYQDVVVKDGAVLTMSSGYSTYHFKKLTIENALHGQHDGGDYYIEELEVKVASFINVIGSGTVRLHVKNKAIFQTLSTVNGGLFGDAAKLYLYFFADGDNTLKVESTSSIAGFVYSEGGVELTSYSGIYGSVTAAGQILIKDAAFISHRGSRLEYTDFGNACPASGSAVNHYRFEYGGAGLTCQSQSVTVRACAMTVAPAKSRRRPVCP